MDSIHERLLDLLTNEFDSSIQDEPQFLYDGIRVAFNNDVELSIIYPAEGEYSFAWKNGGKEWRIDTAPVHKDIPTSPNHLHTADGEVREDGVTGIKNSPEDNLRAVVGHILKN